MAESPVSVAKVECGNGKKKLVIREREYDALSWHGLKMIVTALVAGVGVIVAILTAYYTAEASQNTNISVQAQGLTKIEERQDNRKEAVDNVLLRIDRTLTDQHKLIRESNNTLIEVQTTQKIMKERFDEVAEDVKNLGK